MQSVENPRKEAEEHYYNPTYQGLQDIGVKPNYLTDGALDEMLATVINYTPNVDKEIIFRGVKW